MGGCLHCSSEIDTGNEGKLANDLRAPANGQRILVVHGRIIDGDRNVARHEILLVHFDHAGRNLSIGLCCQQCLERHRHILGRCCVVHGPRVAPLFRKKAQLKRVLSFMDVSTVKAGSRALADMTAGLTWRRSVTKRGQATGHAEAYPCGRALALAVSEFLAEITPLSYRRLRASIVLGSSCDINPDVGSMASTATS